MVNHDDRYHVVTSSGLDWEQDWLMDPGYPAQEFLAAAEDGMLTTEVMREEDEYLWICSSNTGYRINYVEAEPDAGFIEMIMEVLQDPDVRRALQDGPRRLPEASSPS